jgi:Fe-S-cluster containining protein
MTNPCEACDMEEKVYVCCGRHPETGLRVPLQIGVKRTVLACPCLEASGRCTVYSRRPGACRAFFCDGFDTFTFMADIFPVPTS